MKMVLKSILVVVVIAGSWVGAHQLIFEKQLAEKALLSKTMREQACVVDELKTLSRQATASRYESILSPALEALIAKIPSSPDISQLIEQLTELSKKSKVGLVSYETGEHQQNVSIEVRVSGRLKQVFAFIEGLSTLERFVVIERFSYENRTAEIGLSAPWGEFDIDQVSARHSSYHCGEFAGLNLQAIELPWKLATFQKIPMMKRSPFIEPIHHMTSHGLHLVGLVQQRSAWLALVEDEHGFGQVVKVGEKLPNGFQVMEISRNGLSLMSGGIKQTMFWRKP